jgi:hypothetical protein
MAKRNPVPPAVGTQLNDAKKLYERFTGHDGEIVDKIDKPKFPDVVLVIGDLDFVGYTTVRDGKVEKYIHKFKKQSRPLLVASPDGTELFILGGEYDFTERGIVDRKT